MAKKVSGNAERRRIIMLLESIWDVFPDQRFGQLLENFVFVDGERGDSTSQRMFFQEDTKTIENAERAYFSYWDNRFFGRKIKNEKKKN